MENPMENPEEVKRLKTRSRLMNAGVGAMTLPFVGLGLLDRAPTVGWIIITAGVAISITMIYLARR